MYKKIAIVLLALIFILGSGCSGTTSGISADGLSNETEAAQRNDGAAGNIPGGKTGGIYSGAPADTSANTNTGTYGTTSGTNGAAAETGGATTGIDTGADNGENTGTTDGTNAGATGWEPSIYETVNNLEGAVMSVKDGTSSPTGLTVVLENESDSDCIYGEYFSLERKVNGEWYQVPVAIEGDYAFNAIGYGLPSGQSSEWTVDWGWLYGALEAGEYRILKDVSDFRATGDYDVYYLTAEFSIRGESAGKKHLLNNGIYEINVIQDKEAVIIKPSQAINLSIEQAEHMIQWKEEPQKDITGLFEVELHINRKDDIGLELDFELCNVSEKAVEFSFDLGREFDFYVINSRGVEVYRYSYGSDTYLPAISHHKLDPAEKLKLSSAWDYTNNEGYKVPQGIYEISVKILMRENRKAENPDKLTVTKKIEVI